MLATVKSMALNGLDGYLVDVQVDVSGGLPGWEIVGLPDTSVKEAKERVKAAIRNSGEEFPSRRIVVNLAPASTRKEGTLFDLSIAVGLLVATERIKNEKIDDTMFIGELFLDGTISKVSGILPMCIEAYKLGMKRVILPVENAKEAAVVNGLEIIPVVNLKQVIRYLNKEEDIEKVVVDIDELFSQSRNYKMDFSEVKGQENIKRALEIAAAGAHNCLLIRKSTDRGKTMLSRRIPSILPDLSFEEALEITKIHSVAGKLDKDSFLITSRPFRSPHHTVSGVSLIGGGRIPKPRRNKSKSLRSAIFR